MSALGRSSVLLLGGIAALGLAAWTAHRRPSGPEPSLGGRLAGPLAGIVAGARSVAADAELQRGARLRALAQLEGALELAPSRTDIWLQLIALQGLQFASAERESDVSVRASWTLGALDAAQRGYLQAGDPEWVARFAIAVLRAQIDSEPPLTLPPGSMSLPDRLVVWQRLAPQAP